MSYRKAIVVISWGERTEGGGAHCFHDYVDYYIYYYILHISLYFLYKSHICFIHYVVHRVCSIYVICIIKLN